MLHSGRLLHLLLFVCVVFFILGCGTFKPKPMDEVPFKDRAVTQKKGQVRVTAAVLSEEESEAVFGVPLYKKRIQPVWLEIENSADHPMWFLPAGLDRNYFPPLEVAYMHRISFAAEKNREMERLFYENDMGKYIAAGIVKTGFVFTNLNLGTKSFNVDILTEDKQIQTFTFFIPVPGFKADHSEVDWNSLYAKSRLVTHDESSLRKALEELPCCVTDQAGAANADPINLIFVGHDVDVHQALIRSGWDETASEAQADNSFRFPWQDRYGPVKPLFLYGRKQDVAFRKTREAGRERNQIRLWVSPMNIDGKPVWVGQVSRIIQEKTELGNAYIIEPDVDEARLYLLQDLLYAQGLLKVGYVKGVGEAPISKPRTSLNKDTYFTDGQRTVIWVASGPVPFEKVKLLDWEVPPPRK